MAEIVKRGKAALENFNNPVIGYAHRGDTIELSDCYIEPPDVDCEGAIRRRDTNGNCEEVRRIGDKDYGEFRNMFADDALYFSVHDGSGDSDEVYRDYENAKDQLELEDEGFEIEAFSYGDIPRPVFLDCDNPKYHSSDNDPREKDPKDVENGLYGPDPGQPH